MLALLGATPAVVVSVENGPLWLQFLVGFGTAGAALAAAWAARAASASARATKSLVNAAARRDHVEDLHTFADASVEHLEWTMGGLPVATDGPSAEQFRIHFPEAMKAVDAWNAALLRNAELWRTVDAEISRRSAAIDRAESRPLKALLQRAASAEFTHEDLEWKDTVTSGYPLNVGIRGESSNYALVLPQYASQARKISAQVTEAVSEMATDPEAEAWRKGRITGDAWTALKADAVRALRTATLIHDPPGKCSGCPPR
jgi:hypothetical protein